ncbi:hypothetical protein SAMN05443575_0269 [Jatrophihabitans endophyticus]|uniref:Uncharacterized protein n=1 Tax=Jatrophihabitans endophyticus TaxID=1206085 RepID=A0A1M5CJY0_9ACTN|nr:hypothetical protein [Jatrophihabitans endophyticus]SHF55023.1 hypothetical protein SAMN05443575_0269 [Jatrophihabitans endophyticus]
MPGHDPAPLDVLRECQDREFSSDGIPMLLALVDERGAVPGAGPVPAPGTAATGAALARTFDAYRRALTPSAREGDMGCVISVLQAVAYDDFGREARS